jgi:hypothetical protein
MAISTISLNILLSTHQGGGSDNWVPHSFAPWVNVGQTGRTPLFASDAPPDIFLFQLPNPLLQELPLWVLLGQRQSFPVRRPSLSGPAQPAVHIRTGGMRYSLREAP